MKIFSPCALVCVSDAACTLPDGYWGDWFSMEMGDDIDTLMNEKMLSNQFFEGECVDRWDDNSTVDALGNFDSKILFLDR